MENGTTGAIVARKEFGAEQTAMVPETASTAMAAQAQAIVQARYIMALQRPRDWDDVRVKLLRECSRSSFAAVARYRKPIGAGIEGPSIRFAEAAIRYSTNVSPESFTIYDDALKRIIKVQVTDLESNVTYSKDIVVDKVVERSKLRGGQVALSSRTNSAGAVVYLVTAGEDDLLNKEGALVSKAIRTLALRLLPGDILEECMAKVVATLREGVEKDPDGERKRLADAFSMLNIQPSDLKDYLGHDLGTVSPAELVELRALYTEIKDGRTSWQDALDAQGGEARAKADAPAPKKKTQAIADQIRGSGKPVETTAAVDDPYAGRDGETET